MRSKTRCNGRFLELARRAKPETICGVKYSSLEVGALGRRASDKELPPATLSCEIARVERESNDSVSEHVQRGSEVDNVWCRNVLADHPSWAQSPGQAEEEAGEVGMLGGPVSSGTGAARAGISPGQNVNGFDGIGIDGSDILEAGDRRPVALEDFTTTSVGLALPSDSHPCPLKAEIEAANTREEAADAHT